MATSASTSDGESQVKRLCVQAITQSTRLTLRRLRDGCAPDRTGEETLDGCAIFVKRADFAIVSSHPIEFFVPEHPVLDRHNVALAAVVEWRRPSSSSSSQYEAPQRLLIATTHVLFNPKVRLGV